MLTGFASSCMPMGIVFWLLVSARGGGDALNRYVCHVPGREAVRGQGWNVCRVCLMGLEWILCCRLLCSEQLFFPSRGFVKTPRQKIKLAFSLADSPLRRGLENSSAAEQFLGGHAPC